MIIVVTGNIGCGKSTVAAMIAERLPLCTVINYDYIVDELYTTCSEFTDQLVKSFGTSVKHEISNLVFTDNVALATLKRIASPYVNQAVNSAYQDAGNNIVFDAPLWFEDQMYQWFPYHFVVVVVADEATQLMRVTERSGWSYDKTLSVISNQLPQALKLSYADYSISNVRTVDMLSKQVDDCVNTALGIAHD